MGVLGPDLTHQGMDHMAVGNIGGAGFHSIVCGAGWLEGSLQIIQLSFFVSGSHAQI
jgi:hypothetical protein